MYGTYNAIYARQSILKEDSISVESQIEYCRYETRGEPYKEYIDRGYSGKNTNRPAFEEMFRAIQEEKVSKVIVYKLDRISRSILDFSNMMEKFQKHNVEFISTTEKFDTSTPIGRAMLNICIVFAQLERETIQKRVADAYYSRSKKGFYMGGRLPYGFTIEKTVIGGVNTSQYAVLPEESEQIKLLYFLYADKNKSLGDIIRYLKEHQVENLRGGAWSTARISEILRNPVYVKADADVYEFFKKQGTNIVNPITDFIGMNACYLYKGAESNSRKQSDLKDKELVLAPHEGIISSEEWLACRRRCLNNRQSATAGKAKNSWLTGKIKCGKCGYALTIVKAKTRWERYFVCSSKLRTKKCSGVGKTLYAEILEEFILNAMKQKLSRFSSLTDMEESGTNPKINEVKIHIAQIDEEIEGILKNISSANEVLMCYMNEKIESLDRERTRLKEEMKLIRNTNQDAYGKVIKNPMKSWEKLSYPDKQAVVDALIRIIYITEERIEVIWNI